MLTRINQSFGRALKLVVKSSNRDFVRLPADSKFEEETLPDYVASRYYPVRIGDVLHDRYQILGKLGFGTTSTAWLARDMKTSNDRKHVALKIFICSTSMGERVDAELNIYRHIQSVSVPQDPGLSTMRPLFDFFEIEGPNGQHRCLVHPALWDSISAFLRRNPVERLPVPVLAFLLKCLFVSLDFLHARCQIVHTDIKADNIMLVTGDDSAFTAFEKKERRKPSPRKELDDGRFVYVSRKLGMPKLLGAPILCDFGAAVVMGNGERREVIQPNVYRAPEVIMEAGWTYSADIWNVGCMIWDIFEGGHLFGGYDPEHKEYSSRAHLAEMVALLGPPPPSLIARGNSASKFFSATGEFHAGIPLPERTSLEDQETTYSGDKAREDKACFLRLIRKMLQWEPEKRSTAKELLEDEWVCRHTS